MSIRYYLEPLGEDVVPAVEEDGEGEESRVLIYPEHNGVSQSVSQSVVAWAGPALTFTDLGSPST